MTLLEQCQKWFKEGEVDKIEEVVMSLSEEERTPELLSELGRVWIYRSADSMIEEECCNRAIEILKPLEQDLSDNHNYQYRMGMAYEGLQQYQPAKAHFEKALELLPDDEDTIAMIELCDRMMGGISLEPWERFSIMRGVYPKGKENFFEENLRERLDSLDDVKCVAFEYSEEENAVAFKVIYQDNEYDFDMFMDGFDSDIIFELQRKYFTKENQNEKFWFEELLEKYLKYINKKEIKTIFSKMYDVCIEILKEKWLFKIINEKDLDEYLYIIHCLKSKNYWENLLKENEKDFHKIVFWTFMYSFLKEHFEFSKNYSNSVANSWKNILEIKDLTQHLFN